MKTRQLRRLQWLTAVLFCHFLAMTGNADAQGAQPDENIAPSQTALSAAAAGRSAPSHAEANASPGQTAPQAASSERDVSERTILRNFLQDQKDMWLFPAKLSREDHWAPAAIVVGLTAGLLVADAHDTPYFRQTKAFDDFNSAFASNITNSEILAAPASFYMVGLFNKDPYARKTGLLAGEALADVTVLSAVVKAVTRQIRPEAIPARGNFSDTFFSAKGNPLSSGFPSGHAISAFAVATIIARRYGRQHRWVPFVAYGAAAAIGFSRVTTQAHFPSDVFLGAALGYAVARFDVLRGPAFAPSQ